MRELWNVAGRLAVLGVLVVVVDVVLGGQVGCDLGVLVGQTVIGWLVQPRRGQPGPAAPRQTTIPLRTSADRLRCVLIAGVMFEAGAPCDRWGARR